MRVTITSHHDPIRELHLDTAHDHKFRMTKRNFPNDWLDQSVSCYSLAWNIHNRSTSYYRIWDGGCFASHMPKYITEGNIYHTGLDGSSLREPYAQLLHRRHEGTPKAPLHPSNLQPSPHNIKS
ncbi:hypothetical protein TNCV_416521 [Trichonephila clavipes]|nr:hypothetical protein TNCV_416521 [Trichonephila clavipes]